MRQISRSEIKSRAKSRAEADRAPTRAAPTRGRLQAPSRREINYSQPVRFAPHRTAPLGAVPYRSIPFRSALQSARCASFRARRVVRSALAQLLSRLKWSDSVASVVRDVEVTLVKAAAAVEARGEWQRVATAAAAAGIGKDERESGDNARSGATSTAVRGLLRHMRPRQGLGSWTGQIFWWVPLLHHSRFPFARWHRSRRYSRGSLFSAWNKERVGGEREKEGEDVLQYRDRAQ